jgi:hypothetical protein
MRDVDRRASVSRRAFLRDSATVVPAAAAAAAGLTISASSTWAQAATNLRPATMATLARAARDIYPHDSFPDSLYMVAVGGYDAKAKDPAVHELMEGGVASLDAESRRRNGAVYLDVAWEDDRVAVLRTVEATPFFAKLRSDLVVSLYNQKAVWTKLGYEGSSADKGGYIERGFGDIDWLPQA